MVCTVVRLQVARQGMLVERNIETYKWHACLDTPFRSSFSSSVYLSRSPALCKHCTIPFEPASIPKCALVKHVRGSLLLRGRDPPRVRVVQAREISRENSWKDFFETTSRKKPLLSPNSSSVPKKVFFFFLSPLFYLGKCKHS